MRVTGITTQSSPMGAPVLAPASAPAARIAQPAAPKPQTPAMELYYKVNKDLLEMPGVSSLRFYGSARPNELGVMAIDNRAAATLSAMLEPVINGVRLNVYAPGSKEPYTGPGGSVRERIGVINAIKGVWDHRATVLPRGNGHVTFYTTGQDVIDRIDPFVRDRYHMGFDARNWPKWINVKWKAGVPTPPTPKPTPPTPPSA